VLKPEEVTFYEQSYIYKHSKFGINSPISLSNPTKTKNYTVLYRERLYFPANEEEQKMFLKEPSKYVKQSSIPPDVQIRPKIQVHGYSKCGKSTLCSSLAQKAGVVHLRMP